MRWFRNRCASRRESLCLLASGALLEPEARELEVHLAECAGCRQYFNELKGVAVPLAGWERIFADVEPDQATQRRWARALETAPSNQGVGQLLPMYRSAGVPPAAASPGTAQGKFVRHFRRQRAAAETAALRSKAQRAHEVRRVLSPTPIQFLRHGARETLAKLWFELIWPARRIWAGLAAVWVALAIFNISQAGGRETVVAKSTVPAAEVRLAFQEQQRLLAEILGPPPAAAPAEPPRRNSRPRSERPTGWRISTVGDEATSLECLWA
jgi:hypothetical protein